jgi:hypothetical protein
VLVGCNAHGDRAGEPSRCSPLRHSVRHTSLVGSQLICGCRLQLLPSGTVGTSPVLFQIPFILPSNFIPTTIPIPSVRHSCTIYAGITPISISPHSPISVFSSSIYSYATTTSHDIGLGLLMHTLKQEAQGAMKATIEDCMSRLQGHNSMSSGIGFLEQTMWLYSVSMDNEGE